MILCVCTDDGGAPTRVGANIASAECGAAGCGPVARATQRRQFYCSAGVGEFDRRQVSYLVSCEIESDAVGSHVFDSANWNGDLLLAPQVPILEKYMCHVVIFGINNESSDPPDVAIAGMYVFAAANLHLARWYTVVNHDLGRVCHTRTTPLPSHPCPRRVRSRAM